MKQKARREKNPSIDPDTTVPSPSLSKKAKRAKKQQQTRQQDNQGESSRMVLESDDTTVAVPLKNLKNPTSQGINLDSALGQARRVRKLEKKMNSARVKKISDKPALVLKSAPTSVSADNAGVSDYISLNFPDNKDGKEKLTLPDHGRADKVNGKRRSQRRLNESQSMVPPVMAHPWTKGNQYGSLANVAVMLHQEILDFVRYISPSPEEHVMRKYVIRCIEKLVLELWPDAQVVVFGSFNTQLYLPTSDIDLVVLFSHPKNFKNPLHKLASALHNSGVAQKQSLQIIEKTKVPIVKFIEAVTGIHVDVSFNLTTGIASARVSKRLLRSTPALRPLTMVMKHFLHQRGLNQVFLGGLGSYSVMCMIMSFLQIHPKVVSGEIKAEHNLGVLLIELLELYGKFFNYEQVGIRVDKAGGYYYKIPQIQLSRHKPHRSPLLSIQDPQDPNNDVAKGSFAILTVRNMLNGAYEQLTRTMFERNLEIEGVRAPDRGQQQRGLHTRFGDDGTHDNVDNHLQVNSILGVIVSVPPDVIRQREHVVNQFRAGVMQQMCGELEEGAYDDDKEEGEGEGKEREEEEEEEEEEEYEEEEIIREGIVMNSSVGSKHGRDIDASFSVYKRAKIGFDMRNRRSVEYMQFKGRGDVEYVAEDEGGGEEGGTGWHEDENMLNLPQLIGIDKGSAMEKAKIPMIKEERETAKRRVAFKRKFWKEKAGDQGEFALE